MCSIVTLMCVTFVLFRERSAEDPERFVWRFHCHGDSEFQPAGGVSVSAVPLSRRAGVTGHAQAESREGGEGCGLIGRV